MSIKRNEVCHSLNIMLKYLFAAVLVAVAAAADWCFSVQVQVVLWELKLAVAVELG